ncbi:hypothetical protein PAESOLCIP111_02384 [Paenibacillus solanacearum]|uniref:Uncharacterized protein n=1 Tax=Paenibacillus solanacearum TaxID=2048548 RepID=A0A916K3Z3_9BACL|nr:hypothetical protein [Paenibacillus solanacearum]CAG7622024.1 hypothetical protein PAESOLCIP111_02384 [Paenibacillus solanacearum]
MKQYQIMINGVPFSGPLNEIDAFRIYEANKYCVKNIELIELCSEPAAAAETSAPSAADPVACSEKAK